MAGYEVRDEYKEVTDPSIYVKVKVKGKNEYILIWTTTPWTLPSNIAIAVHPEFDYAKVKVEDEVLILSKERLGILKKEYKILEEFKGDDLRDIEYLPILEIPVQKEIRHRVVTAPELVNLNEGTGCVHIAPGHGEEDFSVGRRNNLQVLSPVDEAGRFDIEPYKGIYVRDANPGIIENLKESKKLFREEKISHRYPHCWRCKTPLILRMTKQWFLAVSKISDNLVEKNREIEWIPDWIGSGRFENWLKEAKDWCISRQRYWNTPLPIWQCECGEIEVIGSINELYEKSKIKFEIQELDIHRPAIDGIKLKCKCGKEMSRVKDVMDVWLDSGSASWANLRYPQNKEGFEELFPADFITEGSDQTRGWFYSLLVSSVIAFDRIPYKKVLYHGFALDSEGRKMSKSLGNVIATEDVIEKYGADVFRFYVLWTTVPWEDLRFSWEGIDAVNRTLNILWNVYSFAETYMRLDGFDPNLPFGQIGHKNFAEQNFSCINKKYDIKFEPEDKWLLSRFNSLVKEVTDGLDRVHPHAVCRPIYDFILELSRWYIKLVRDRVWIEGDNPKKISIYYTLHMVLTGLSRLMAVITPHISEGIYRKLTNERSVHLSDWLKCDENAINKELEKKMLIAQQITECVLSMRQDAKIKLRWPIQRVIIAMKGEQDIGDIEPIILKMSNAKKIQKKDIETKLIVRPNLPVIGPKFRGDAGGIIKKLEGCDASKIKEEIEKTGEFRIDKVTLRVEDIIFETKLPENIVARGFEFGVVYIDSKLDEKLISEAMAREVIRRIQQMRKEMNLNELEVVEVFIKCDKEFENYINENKNFVEKETRGMINFGDSEGFKRDWEIEDSELTISINPSKS